MFVNGTSQYEKRKGKARDAARDAGREASVLVILVLIPQAREGNLLRMVRSKGESVSDNLSLEGSFQYRPLDLI